MDDDTRIMALALGDALAQHFGQAGHLCVGDRCRFHLHTHINGVCVSTVGDYYPRYDDERPTKINSTSLYETMVFRLDENGETADWTEIDADRYDTRDEANAGHALMVATWQTRTSLGGGG